MPGAELSISKLLLLLMFSVSISAGGFISSLYSVRLAVKMGSAAEIQDN